MSSIHIDELMKIGGTLDTGFARLDITPGGGGDKGVFSKAAMTEGSMSPRVMRKSYSKRTVASRAFISSFHVSGNQLNARKR